MNVFKVTASNNWEWQDLQVVANDAEQAAGLFRAYLAGEDNQREELYAFRMVVQQEQEKRHFTYDADELPEIDEDEIRDNARYSFNPDNIEHDEDADATKYPPHEVCMMNSGGDG